MKKCLWVIAGLVVGAGPLCATAAGNAVDVFYIPSADFEISSGGTSIGLDGDGFGAQGAFRVSDFVRVGVEYQTVEMDVPIDITQLRFTLGGALPLSSSILFSADLGYIDTDIETSMGDISGDGPMGHIGLVMKPSDQVEIFGKVGIVKVEESDGPEFHFGGRVRVTDAIGLMVDYRLTKLEDSGEDLELDDLRVGVSFWF